MGVILKTCKILSVSKSDFWPLSKNGIPVQIVIRYPNSGNAVDPTKKAVTIKKKQIVINRQIL